MCFALDVDFSLLARKEEPGKMAWNLVLKVWLGMSPG